MEYAVNVFKVDNKVVLAFVTHDLGAIFHASGEMQSEPDILWLLAHTMEAGYCW